jgi:hypothetical protein
MQPQRRKGRRDKRRELPWASAAVSAPLCLCGCIFVFISSRPTDSPGTGLKPRPASRRC